MLMRRLMLIVLAVALVMSLTAWILPAAAVPAAQSCGPGVVHVVQPGENVFRISLRYGTTVGAITVANGLPNPNVIYAGQQLLIPCPSGVVLPIVTPPPPIATLPPYVPTPIFIAVPGVPPVQVVVPSGGSVTVPQPVTQVNCFGFRPTSPLDGMSNSNTAFYWDGAPGAQSYRVNIYNLDRMGGAIAAVYVTNGPFTRLTGDTSVGAIGEGFRFAWNVQAVVDGRAVCATAPVVQYRAAS
jgi:LysM repeat protein